MAVLTNGFTALVSINEGHDGAQGHVWVPLEALQVADGLLDVVCRESPHGYALGLLAQRAGGSMADTLGSLSELTQGLTQNQRTNWSKRSPPSNLRSLKTEAP